MSVIVNSCIPAKYGYIITSIKGLIFITIPNNFITSNFNNRFICHVSGCFSMRLVVNKVVYATACGFSLNVPR